MNILNDENELITSWRGNATLALKQRDEYAAWRRSLHRKTKIAMVAVFLGSLLIGYLAGYTHWQYRALHAAVAIIVIIGTYYLVDRTHRKPPCLDEWEKYEGPRNVIAGALNLYTRVIEAMDHHELKTLVLAKIQKTKPAIHQIPHGECDLCIMGDDNLAYDRLVAAAKEFNIHPRCKRTH
ncbi:MAG: hypothetical protein KBD47_00500 [Candidatus Pacebacteria bacterium]|jgi:Na+/melibiose symporter-like transporter|nr:hypothetical protein [Candidatus Paceibacterota bacterium]